MAYDRLKTAAPPSRRPGQEPAPTTGTGPVIGRALQILGAFTAEHPYLSLSDLARRASLPVSTVHRMLGELLAWGALERDAQGRYRVGLRLWEVGSLAPRSQGIRELAMPHLHDLSALTRENRPLPAPPGSWRSVGSSQPSRSTRGRPRRGSPRRRPAGPDPGAVGRIQSLRPVVATVTPRPIIASPPTPPTMESRRGERANQSRAVAAARPHTQSEATAMTLKTSPSTSI